MIARFSRRVSWVIVLALSVCAHLTCRGFALLGGSYPSGTITLQLQLDATAPASPRPPLQDGSTSWNAVAQAAANDWNAAMTNFRSRLDTRTSSATTSALNDGTNSVRFASRTYDSEFDDFTLATTITYRRDASLTNTVRLVDADVLVNNRRTWNSYRGAYRSNPVDLRRVLLHEFGHLLGLEHPDQNAPSSIPALMNKVAGDMETLQDDDRSGAAYLYNTALFSGSITRQPTSQTVSASQAVRLSVQVDNREPPAPQTALLGYSWYFKPTGASTYEKLFTIETPDLNLGSAQLLDSGSYYLEVLTPDRRLTSDPVTVTVNPITTSTITSLANLSTRGLVPANGDTATSAMIVGFVVTGSQPKRVLLRSVGPTLGGFGVAGTLADPLLTLRNGSTTVATSPTTWDQTNGAALRSAMESVGAFALPAGSKDAVILATLNPGAYTAQTTSPSGARGVVLVEAYDVDGTSSSSRLANLSTRGYTGSGADVLIAGFVIRGPGPRTYLIRGIGQALKGFGVSDTVKDPLLKLYTGSTWLRDADDWDTPAAAKSALETAMNTVGAFALGTTGDARLDSAMLVTLQPGSYTAQATGNTNGGADSPTGNTLIEIYEMP